MNCETISSSSSASRDDNQKEDRRSKSADHLSNNRSRHAEENDNQRVDVRGIHNGDRRQRYGEKYVKNTADLELAENRTISSSCPPMKINYPNNQKPSTSLQSSDKHSQSTRAVQENNSNNVRKKSKQIVEKSKIIIGTPDETLRSFVKIIDNGSKHSSHRKRPRVDATTSHVRLDDDDDDENDRTNIVIKRSCQHNNNYNNNNNSSHISHRQVSVKSYKRGQSSTETITHSADGSFKIDENSCRSLDDDVTEKTTGKLLLLFEERKKVTKDLSKGQSSSKPAAATTTTTTYDNDNYSITDVTDDDDDEGRERVDGIISSPIVSLRDDDNDNGNNTNRIHDDDASEINENTRTVVERNDYDNDTITAHDHASTSSGSFGPPTMMTRFRSGMTRRRSNSNDTNEEYSEIVIAPMCSLDDCYTVNQCEYVVDVDLNAEGHRALSEYQIPPYRLAKMFKESDKHYKNKRVLKELTDRHPILPVRSRTLSYMRHIEAFRLGTDYQFYGVDVYKTLNPPEDMRSLWSILKPIESEPGFSPIRFVRSTLGTTLLDYTTYGDKTWETVHKKSNQRCDLLRYPLRYGMIPSKYTLAMVDIVRSLLLVQSAYIPSFATRRKHKSKGGGASRNQQEQPEFDFIEGELEVLMYTYWTMETVDLFTYNERVERSAQKKLLFHLFAEIYRSTHEIRPSMADYAEQFIKLLQKHGDFLNDQNHVSTKCVALVKSNVTCYFILIAAMPLPWYRLLGIFFDDLKVYHHSSSVCVDEMFQRFDDTVKRLETVKKSVLCLYHMTAADDQNNDDDNNKATSAWASALHEDRGTPESTTTTIFQQKHACAMFPNIFRRPTHADHVFLVALDNFAYYHMFLMARYLIDAGLLNGKKSDKIISYVDMQMFFKHQCRPENNEQYHVRYCRSLAVEHVKELKPSVLSTIRNLARTIVPSDTLNTISRPIGIYGFDDCVYRSFFDWCLHRIDYAIFPAIYRYVGIVGTPFTWSVAFARALDSHVSILNNKQTRIDVFRCDELYKDEKDRTLTDNEDDDDDDLKYRFDSSDDQYDEDDDYVVGGTEDDIDKLKKQRECVYAEDYDDGEADFNDTDFDDEERSVNENRLTDELRLLLSDQRGDMNKWVTMDERLSDDDDDDDDAGRRARTKKKSTKCSGPFKYKRMECNNDEGNRRLFDGNECFGTVVGDSAKPKHVKMCSFCAASRITSHLVIGEADVCVVRSCTLCIDKINGLILTKAKSYDELRRIIVTRIDERVQPPILFNKNKKFIDLSVELPKIRSKNFTTLNVLLL